jgi:hypothetical protein
MSASDRAQDAHPSQWPEKSVLSVEFFPLIGYTVLAAGGDPLALSSVETAELRT